MNLHEWMLDHRQRRGVLEPEGVVEEATPEDSPVHHLFEWDDAVAGHSYRLDQARRLIARVRVSYTPPGSDEVRTVRAFHAVPKATAGAAFEYVPVQELVDDPLRRAMVLATAEREWRQLKARYDHLAEFLDRVRADVA